MEASMSQLKLAVAGAGLAFGALALVISLTPVHADDVVRSMPAPVQDEAPQVPGLQTATFAGGCFWGVQGVFEHVAGVTQAVSGYAGGHVADPDYEQVSSGSTGHAESVRVTYDPSRVSYGRLLQIFFSVALDPTQVDRQGPDYGTQYRSELFVQTAEQEHVARAYVAQLDASHVFARPIATRIDRAGSFYPAEAYHQDYLVRHPDAGYIVVNDLPKVHNLQTLFPQSWQDKPVLVGKAPSAS
jgi:peptide-methionine (S)-S-oxide reductase